MHHSTRLGWLLLTVGAPAPALAQTPPASAAIPAISGSLSSTRT